MKRCREDNVRPVVSSGRGAVLALHQRRSDRSGLSLFAPEAAALKAGRLMLEEIAACVAEGKSFAFETTLAGVSYLERIRQWRAQGYHVNGARLSR